MESFDNAWAASERWLFGRLWGLTHGDRELTNDLLQETAERAFRSWPPMKNPRGFLYSIATNLFNDEARRRNLRQVIPIDEALVNRAAAEDIESIILAGDLSSFLGPCVQDLSALRRAIVIEADALGMRHADVMRRLGMTDGAFRRQLLTARKQLRDCMRRKGIEHAT